MAKYIRQERGKMTDRELLAEGYLLADTQIIALTAEVVELKKQIVELHAELEPLRRQAVFLSTCCDAEDDRMYHAADQTWWHRDGLRWHSASAPAIASQMQVLAAVYQSTTHREKRIAL